MEFYRPTDYYDENIYHIDEQISSLFQERKRISNNKPGCPPPEYIREWSEKYELIERFLQIVFKYAWDEKRLVPRVTPVGFRKHIPLLKWFEKDKHVYSMTHVVQYSNASVLNLHIDWDTSEEEPGLKSNKGSQLEVDLGDDYEVKSMGGGGHQGHRSYKYVVTPPLPDDLSEMTIMVQEYRDLNKQKPTDLRIMWDLT